MASASRVGTLFLVIKEVWLTVFFHKAKRSSQAWYNTPLNPLFLEGKQRPALDMMNGINAKKLARGQFFSIKGKAYNA